MEELLLYPVFVPMVCGVIAYLMGQWKEGMRDMFVSTAVGLELLLVLTLLTNPALEGARLTIEGFCGLAISLRDGQFHTLMALLTATGWFTATIFCKEYMPHVQNQNRFYLFWLITLGATMGIFLSADLFTTFLFFELMSLTSFVFVIQTEEPEALQAGETYLAVAVIGGLCTLTGLVLLYGQLGTLSIEQLGYAAANATNRKELWVAGILVLIGFAAKAGVAPLHIWLPTAHPAAPAPASAVLSGILIKTGIYGILVLTSAVFLHDVAWGALMTGLGVVTMVLGAVLAVCSIDIKRTLACSSISQIGFILVGTGMVCLLGEHNVLAADGTILHIVNHSLVKMMLFPIAGIIHLTSHTYDLNELRGFGRSKPLLAVVMLVLMLSLSGLPFLNGYVSKTLLHESIVELIHESSVPVNWVLTGVEWIFLFTGGLTFAYMLKLFFCLFIDKGNRDWALNGEYMAEGSAATLLTYSTLLIMLGLMPNDTMDTIASFARPFLSGAIPDHEIDYFSWVNIKGSLYSLGIGTVIFVVIVRKLLYRKGVYCDPIPQKFSIEMGIYRPALKWLGQLFIVAATLVDCLPFRLLSQTIPRYVRAWMTGLSHVRTHLASKLMGEEQMAHSNVEQVADDYHFAFYDDEPQKPIGFVHSLAFGLMLTGFGLCFCLAFILLHK